VTAILGAVLAGGKSSRFGQDKALVEAFGKPLIEYSIEALTQVTPDIVICGRELAGRICVADRPEPGMGPLGGLNAALHHAAGHGFAWVLSVACDTPAIPPGLLRDLAGQQRPSFVPGHPLMGLWPASAADHLDTWLAETTRHAVRGWAQAIGADPVGDDIEIANFNHADDFDSWVKAVRPPER
jgi:molybdenum cofactor guanylyltransferase